MRMRNEEVVRRFVADSDYPHDGYGSVRSTEDGVLLSYGSKMAEWDEGILVVYADLDGTSVTTSTHFKYLHDAIDDHGVPISVEKGGSRRHSGRFKPRWRID